MWGKVENLLNQLDQTAAEKIESVRLLSQNKEQVITKDEAQAVSEDLPRVPSSKNIMVLSKKSTKNDLNWETMSETTSRRSSISSKHDTVIDKSIDQKMSQLVESSSTASLNSFSVERELAATKILASELRSENNELKCEIETLLEQIKANGNSMKIQELEELCTTLQDEKKELTAISQSLESSNCNYVKVISDMETSIMKMQQNENDLKQKLEYSKNEARDANNELQQYRLRAQNQLQLKEKIIDQLKSGNADVSVDKENDETSLQFELDQLRDQRDHLQSELNLLNRRFEDSKNFIEKMEHKHRMMTADTEDKMLALDETISQLNMKASHYEDEIKMLKQEIMQIREDMLKQKTSMTTKLHEKENELKRLKNSYRESNMQTELENRMHSLTQSLLSKQNNLETITAEKNALKFQLEKLSLQHEELLLQSRPQRQLIINMNETDDAKSQFPTFLIPNPFDSRVSRRFKRAYSRFDQIGVQVGVFLRRYPLVRICSVFYVALLHFFVVFVLLSSTPS